MMHYIAP
jgi:hypothetical protein